jgi:hypothetical protein
MFWKFRLRQLLIVPLAALAVLTTSMSKAEAADPYSVNAVQKDLTFTTTFNGNLNGTYLFDIELWNGANQRVWQQFETRTVNGIASLAIDKAVPSLPNGTYKVKGGLFSADWSTKHLWADAGTVTVGTVYGMTTSATATSFTSTFSSTYNFNGTYLFDIELWNSANQRVWQQFETQNVGAKKTVSIAKNVPVNLGNGTYSIRGGIFSGNWSTKYLWTDTAGTLTLQNGKVTNVTATTTPTTATTSTTIKPTTTTTTPPPQPVASYTIASTTAASTFDTKFSSSKNFAGSYLFDIEIWNSDNQRVFQQFETKNVTGTNSVTITKNIPVLPPGTYSIRAGLFSPDWTTKYLWTDAAGSITVASAPNNGGGSPATPPAGPSGYKNLVFGDEFNGDALDQTKWLTCSPQMNYKDGLCYAHDGERQNYLPQNLAITNFAEGGRGLQISANDTNKTWGNTRPNNVPAGSKMYDSGAISTGPNRHGLAKPGYQPFSMKYGYYESRIKMTKGQGYWPAAWTFPSDGIGPWEIDVVEVLGSDTTMADFSAHFPGGSTDEWLKTPDMAAGFHTYGVDWQPDRITWYFDGKVARSVFTDTSKISAKDHYLIFNLAVGGNWPGPPNASTPFPGNMYVDWVRVWTK